MLELLLCSSLTILPDFLFRRFVQGKRLGRDITLFTVWYELRWGITLCVILTLSLITTVFYFHPSSTNVISYFRTISILPEGSGRVEEVYVDYRDQVRAGDPLFRLDSSAQEAAVETARRQIEEVDAEMQVAKSELAEAVARIAQAQGLLQQALDEYNTRAELLKRGETAVSRREVERAQVNVETQQGMYDAAVAARDAMQAKIDFDLPARKASAEAALHEADVALSKTTVYAGVDGWVEQFTLRPGDLVNQMIRPAGILVPASAGRLGLQAGFGQIEAQVLKPGMVGEVTCPAIPFTIIPVVVTQVQSVVSGGQFRPTDALVDPQNVKPGTLLAYMEPLYPGGLDKLPPGSNCIANAYTSNYDALHSGQVEGLHAVALHVVDTVGLVHALILRLQALIIPVRTLVLGGGH